MAQGKKRDMEDLFGGLLELLGEYYESKLKSGELSAQDQKNLIQLLRDNNITIDPSTGEPLSGILDGDFTSFDDMFQRQ